MRYRAPLLALLPLLCTQPAQAAAFEAAEPYRASYKVTVDGFLVGKMERALRPTGDHLVLENVLYTVGLVAVFKDDRFEERSEFRLDRQQSIPLRYVYDYHSGSKQVLERIDFDWRSGKLDSLRDGTTEVLPTQPGMHDKLSYQVQMRYDLAAGKQDLEYQVAERHEVHAYRFHVMGEERLETPFGTLRCLKVERVRSNPKQAHTVFWTAVDMGYFLVQLRQDDDGHTYESRIETLQRTQSGGRS